MIKKKHRRFWIWRFVLVLACCSAQPIAAEPLTLACSEVKPYAESDGLNNGLLADIAVSLGRRAGLTVSIQIMPWKRAFSQAKLGTIDGTFCTTQTDERRTSFAYMEHPIAIMDYVLFKRRETAIDHRTTADLLHYRIVEKNGTAGGDFLKSLGFDNLFFTASEELKFLMLGAGRVDLAGGDRIVGWTAIRQQLPEQANDFEVIGPSLRQSPQFIAISRAKHADADKLARRLDEAYLALSREGELQTIYRRHGMADLMAAQDAAADHGNDRK